MKIAILGARGFLGNFLYKKLSNNHTVIPVVRETVDLLNFNQVQHWIWKNSPQVIINCVANGGGIHVDDINYSNVQKDLSIFLNFFNHNYDFKFINIGSGAEFDRRTSIDQSLEQDIVQCQPLESYGFTKNIVSRLCLEKSNFYTLRLFGCFDKTEPNIRLFKRFLAGKITSINDKWFDYITADDFAQIVEYYCVTSNLKFKDINCVYKEKFLLSDILRMFNDYHNVDAKISIVSNGLSYTGDGRRLVELGLPLEGLFKGIEKYE